MFMILNILSMIVATIVLENTGQPLNSYTDKSMLFEALPTGGISVWLGSQNRKIHSNMNYIIEDK